ncbi:LIM/homeobox protein Lhx9 [Folsomia candida]|uniref:LIM/homeobox protein Lhx9 n=1 Tax=Folsomia candida TaxID=158441 RepID=A0A226EN24_FOLCA|nr:LIM/homeobox protein Lhx9 [Folsomia candida]
MKYIKNGERFAASRTVCAVKETRVKFPPVAYWADPPELEGFVGADMTKKSIKVETNVICTTCHDKIMDRFLLQVNGLQYHTDCLRCSVCAICLQSESSCFFREGTVYCRNDYYRIRMDPMITQLPLSDSLNFRKEEELVEVKGKRRRWAEDQGIFCPVIKSRDTFHYLLQGVVSNPIVTSKKKES